MVNGKWYIVGFKDAAMDYEVILKSCKTEEEAVAELDKIAAYFNAVVI